MPRGARAPPAAGSTFTRPEGGLAVWVTLPDTVDTLALLPDAKRRGVVYAPGTLFHADGRRSSSLRLTVGAAAPDALERGIRALGDAARDAVAAPARGTPGGRAGRDPRLSTKEESMETNTYRLKTGARRDAEGRRHPRRHRRPSRPASPRTPAPRP